MTTARPNQKDLIPQAPFTEGELTESLTDSIEIVDRTIELARDNGYNDAIHDCFELVRDENMPLALQIRLMETINNMTRR